MEFRMLYSYWELIPLKERQRHRTDRTEETQKAKPKASPAKPGKLAGSSEINVASELSHSWLTQAMSRKVTLKLKQTLAG